MKISRTGLLNNNIQFNVNLIESVRPGELFFKSVVRLEYSSPQLAEVVAGSSAHETRIPGPFVYWSTVHLDRIYLKPINHINVFIRSDSNRVGAIFSQSVGYGIAMSQNLR